MTKFTYNALILSAGESRRMGFFPKGLLLCKDGEAFLEKIISNIGKINLHPAEICLVLGYHREKILAEINLDRCRIFTNPDPARGMLSSLQVALKNFAPHLDGLLMCLVDHPLVNPETYNSIIIKAKENPGKIIIPVFGERKGHPVFFPKEIFQDLENAPPDQGARWAVQKNSGRIIFLPTDDGGILKDIDTPELYSQIK